MKNIIYSLLTILLTGCVGVGIISPTEKVEGTSKGYHVHNGTIISEKANPPGKIVTYKHDGFQWAGIGFNIMGIPIPLVVPVNTRKQSVYYNENNESYQVHTSISKVSDFGCIVIVCSSNFGVMWKLFD